MKRIIAMILCLSMAAAISACGAQETGNSTKAGSSVVEEAGDVEAGETDSKKEAKGMDKKDVPEGLNYEYVDRHYGFKFWVSTMNGTNNDAGTSYRFSKNTEGDMANLMIMKYTVDLPYTDEETCDLTQIKSSKDIFEAMKGKFKQDIVSYGIEPIINFKNLETSTINGVEMTKFEGNFVEEQSYGNVDLAFVGYQILAKNRPIMVLVVEQEISSDNSNINQYYDMLDDIVSTFVDEEGGTKEPGYLE